LEKHLFNHKKIKIQN